MSDGVYLVIAFSLGMIVASVIWTIAMLWFPRW